MTGCINCLNASTPGRDLCHKCIKEQVMTFTEEQIREVIEWTAKTAVGMERKDIPELIHDAMKQLARPQPKFREGEVVMNKASEIALVVYLPEDYPAKNYRKLRLSEMPEAVERLRNNLSLGLNNFEMPDGTYERLCDFLADFDREISND